MYSFSCMSIRLKLKGASAQVRFDSDAARCTMPRTRSGAKEPGATCDVENVYREWQDNQAVRQVAVSTDRLFVSHKGEKEPLKFSIKDSVRNMHVVTPVLQRMAAHPSHPLPYLKQIARENPGPLEWHLFLEPFNPNPFKEV